MTSRKMYPKNQSNKSRTTTSPRAKLNRDTTNKKDFSTASGGHSSTQSQPIPKSARYMFFRNFTSAVHNHYYRLISQILEKSRRNSRSAIVCRRCRSGSAQLDRRPTTGSTFAKDVSKGQLVQIDSV